MKILIIGVGGIGSRLVTELDRLQTLYQLDSNVEITLIDGDNVEIKNIKLGQMYKKEYILENKAKVLGKRFMFNYREIFVNDISQLEGFDLIMICVDNANTRRLIFNYCYKNNKDFIDLRAEGNTIAGFLKENNDLKGMLETLGDNGEKSKSCQRDEDIEKNQFQLGADIIAIWGCQKILDKLREKKDLNNLLIKI